MHVLFIHQNFPAQFRYIAPRLARDHGWKCTFVTARPEGTLPGVDKVLYVSKGGATKANHFCTRNFENAVWEAHGVYETLRQRPDIRPDLVVAHTGFGSSLFLPYLYDAPIINFLEYFYAPVGQDVGYRPELPVEELTLLRIKTRNAMILSDLVNCDRAWTPTRYQRDFFPPELRPKIEVIFDGIDTGIYHRRANPQRLLDGRPVAPPGTRIVTYVARGFEMMRGFDIFMEASRRIAEAYPDVVFLVVGGDTVHYGPDLQFIKERTVRESILGSGRYDLSKYVFTGFVPEERLAEILSVSDLHIYLTEPFIASWSLVDAMACGAVVLASDQKCVREYVEHGRNGLLADFFDAEGIARQAVEVLRDPERHRPLAEAAMETVRSGYSVDVAMPRLKAFFESVAARPRSPGTLMKDLARPGTVAAVKDRDGAAIEPPQRQKAPPPRPGRSPSRQAAAKPVAQDDKATRRFRESPLAFAADTPVRPPKPESEAPLERALAELWELGRGRATAKDWIEVAARFQGLPPLAGLGLEHHPDDLAQLMDHLLKLRPATLLEIGTTLGATLFLWTRVAPYDARFIGAGLADRPIPEARFDLFAAFARGGQAMRCIPRGEPAKIEHELNRQGERRRLDFAFLDGLRPFEQVQADFDRCRKWARPGALIAWDGLRNVGPDELHLGGGIRLFNAIREGHPRHAVFSAGKDRPCGGIAAVALD
ncbi:MAG: glycosyltransferase [Rhodocyclaceae bacterium]|nr:glycosyltransferase [Rhodocyclaceae bacterium]